MVTSSCNETLGYHKLTDCFDIEPRFGIALAKKLIAFAHLKGLVQKDASGIVNSLDRVFRGTYNPHGEIDNLHRVMTNLRASFPKDNPNYGEIGASITAGDSLSANGPKDFSAILAFIKRVDELWRSKKKSLAFPELDRIAPKHNAALIEELDHALGEEIKRFPNDADGPKAPNLFLDDTALGYLPDRAIDYTVSLSHNKSTCSTFREVFAKMAALIESAEAEGRSLDDIVKQIKLRFRTDDESVSKAKAVLQFICGDVVLDGEAYFISNGLWYKANAGFIKSVDAELDELLYVSPGDLGLKPWATGDDEDSYIKKHDGNSFIILHRHFVRAKARGPVEFCDLLGTTRDGAISLIHIKHQHGAELRELFAQGHVSAQLYSESEDFRDKLHSTKIDAAADLDKSARKALAGLKKKSKPNFRIVFAIYDDTTGNRPTNTRGTRVSDFLGGTLTLFAKIDLLVRIQSIRGLGYNVALTRIKPYPNKK